MICIVVGAFALFIKLTLPATLQVIIEGQQVEIKHIPNIYSISDVIIVGASCFMLGASIVYLVSLRNTITIPKDVKILNSSASVELWKEVLNGIKNEDEHRIYKLITEEGGSILQSKLVQATGFSKAKVSTILDRLEARGLLERRRHGMSNMVVLKQRF
jgi:uncharacterized membrane protein